jgi:branched-chain amino acid aminotransferase
VQGIRSGITRDSVLTIARDLGVEVIEERFTRDELHLADEAFFSGTAAEITPIREVDNRRIGTGRPGPITKKIQNIYFKAVKGEEDRYRSWLTYL